MAQGPDREQQCLIYDLYRPRHTHTWNMLSLSWEAFEDFADADGGGFRFEYLWEHFVIRLSIYRSTVNTLTQLDSVHTRALQIVSTFDQAFLHAGIDNLRGLRNMLEHFDEYAAGKGRVRSLQQRDIDPWREVTRDRYGRGPFVLERAAAWNAAVRLRDEERQVSDEFLAWFHEGSDAG